MKFYNLPISFLDESGPAAMQHGNSANSIQPLQIFQEMGRTIKRSKQFVYCQLLNFKQTPSTVGHHCAAIPEIVTAVTWLLGSCCSFVVLLMTQLLLHFNMEQTLVSENISPRCSQQRDISAKLKYTNKNDCPKHLLYIRCQTYSASHVREERR